jgi:hypothetical protein
MPFFAEPTVIFVLFGVHRLRERFEGSSFHQNLLHSTASKNAGNQSSWLKMAPHECPGGLANSLVQ